MASFQFDESQKCIRLVVEKKSVVRLSESLAYILGFNDVTHEESHTAEFLPSLRLPSKLIFVQCNIIQPTLVGETRSQLLRVLPCDGPRNFSFSTVHYFPVLYDHVESIHVKLVDEAGLEIPIDEEGTHVTSVTLHFRPITQ